MKHRSLIALILTALVLTAGCTAPVAPAATEPTTLVPSPSQSTVEPRADYWPTAEWRTAAPGDHGVDEKRLTEMDTAVRSNRLALHSILVIRHGYIVHETYFGPHDAAENHDLYSVTKSFVSTLIGIAHDKGLLPGLEQTVLSLLPGEAYDNPSAGKSAMTLEDVLTMRTGLDWDEGDAAYRALWTSPDWVEFMLDKPMVEDPGRTWNYCSGCSHLLSAFIEKAAGMPTKQFAEAELFGPLGIKDYSWSVDSDGTAIGGWGLRLTSRDMAKLGMLYLHGGQWDGKQIVSREWVRAATATHTPTDGKLGYGYQWWTHPTYEGYAALGLGGQTVFVVPRQDLIVVTTAGLQGHEPVWKLIDQYVMPAVQ